MLLTVVLVLGSSPSSSAIGVTRPPGPWVKPLATPVVGEFRPPSQRWLAGHRGVDLQAVSGTPVRAPGPGVVTFANTVVDRPVVVISHGDLRTTLEPVTAHVAVGAAVRSGDLVGEVGAGGHCETRCLHWGLIRDETYLNPLWLVSDYRPVLKPAR